MIKGKTIICDLDSTLIDTSKTIISLHNKLYPSKYIEFNKQHDWQFRPMINSKEELSNLFKLFDHKDFYKDVIVFPNAIEIINKLAENNSVYIVSKHMETRKRLSKEWINKVMPKVEIRFVDNFEDKGKLFDKVDYVIDDKYESFENFGDDTTCILFGDYQWNRDCHYYSRCMNWNEVEGYVECACKFVEQRDYYNKNHLQFAEDYLGIKLKWRQKLFIKHMDKINFKMGRR